MSPGYLHRTQHRSLLLSPRRGPNRTARRARGHHLNALAAVLAVLAVFAALTALTGCTSAGGRTEVIVTGSTTLLPIAEVSGEKYAEEHPGTSILVSGLGSSAGIESVAAGSSDIGTSSRELKDPEKELGLDDTPVAYDAIAVIVHPDNPVTGLTTEQVRSIFTGETTNWRDVGGPDMPIGLVNRDEASGTREAFHKIVMGDALFDRGAVVLPGTGQVRAVVAQVDGAIGYISLGFVTDEVRAIAIDGVQPSEESVVSGEYPVQRVLHFFTKGQVSDAAKDYISYVLSPEVQDSTVREAGFIPITAKEDSGD